MLHPGWSIGIASIPSLPPEKIATTTTFGARVSKKPALFGKISKNHRSTL
jgi:hypothetical protein